MGNYDDDDNDTILRKKINFVVHIMLILHVKPKKHHYSQHIMVTKIKNSEIIKTSFRQIKASGKESTKSLYEATPGIQNQHLLCSRTMSNSVLSCVVISEERYILTCGRSDSM